MIMIFEMSVRLGIFKIMNSEPGMGRNGHL